MADVTCPGCQAVLEYDDADQGSVAECPACGGDVTLPSPKKKGARFINWLRNRLDGRIQVTVGGGESDEERLDRWKKTKDKIVKRSADPPVQFLIENIGTKRTIRYYGGYRKVTPIRVFEKKGVSSPYLEAETDDGVRVFKFEHITLPGKQWEEYYADRSDDDY